MNPLKIAIAAIFFALLAFLLIKWSGFSFNPGEVSPPTNQFVAAIEKELKSLESSPSSAQCKNTYQTIKYMIDTDHKGGNLGTNAKDNDNWKEFLSKDLYSIYSPKVAEFPMKVFGGSDWPAQDIAFIRSEVSLLLRSPFLEQNSNVDNDFKRVSIILNKYDEINNFLSGCLGFSLSYSNIPEEYPLSDALNRITQAKSYLANDLENSYVNNCVRLKEGLSNVSLILFQKHVAYLESKIQSNTGRYNQYSYQSDYMNTIYNPIQKQIEQLDENPYNVPYEVFEANTDRLKQMLQNDNNNAYDYFAN